MTGSPGPAAAGARACWADVALRRFLVQQGVGQLADAMASMALATVIVTELDETITPAGVARALLTPALPLVLAAPIATIVADRVDRRRALALTGCLRALIVVGAAATPIVGGRILAYTVM